MGMCMICGLQVEAGDKAHHYEETPDHLRGWRNIWNWALHNSDDPQVVAQAKQAIPIIDEKLRRLNLA